MEHPHHNHSQKGFSAIELMIAVSVILLVAAIAVPYMLQARAKANEAAAAAALGAIDTAQSLYASAYPDVGYAASLLNLGNHGSTCESATSLNACLIDAALASGLKNGYIFDMTGDGNVPSLSYTVSATPLTSNSGSCIFSSDQSGSIQAQSSANSAMGVSAGINLGQQVGQAAKNSSGQKPAPNETADPAKKQAAKGPVQKNQGGRRVLGSQSAGSLFQQSACTVNMQ